MNEIGERLKDARESMGITIAEAAEDLKLDISQINNLEDGNMETFKDIYSLKYLIRDYSKYLGLDKEDLINEFNEYLFDYTSKISIEDIKKAKSLVKKEEDRIKSPYTIEHNEKIPIYMFIIYVIISLVLVVTTIFVIKEVTKKDSDSGDSVVMNNKI